MPAVFPGRPGARRALGFAAAAFVSALLFSTGIADAAPGTGLFLTLVARVCPTYQDVTANQARNNIMESLQNLGPDTPYNPGEPINPVVEELHQPACKALPGWEFTLGSGYISRAVSGYWGSLSIITGQTRARVETLPSVPLLDSAGKPTGKSIEGAATIELTSREAELSKQADSLWVQGGAAQDPILSKRYPNEYGFAALRCAIDNLNGDNVEWVGYPSGFYKHMFCFAYYVKPPPTAGTIVIRKKVVGHGTGAPETFSFGGNVSYNPDGRFDLTVAPPATDAHATFTRGNVEPGGTPWHVNEHVPHNWKLKGISCASENGKSETKVELATKEASIFLAAADTVTCTYEDEFEPPHGALTVRKESINGTGTFKYRVATQDRPQKDVAKVFATTLEEALAVDGKPSPISLRPADYRINEVEAPKGGRGTWKQTAAGCEGGSWYLKKTTIHVRVESSKSIACTFRNQLVPTAALTIQKKTIGGTGKFGFSIVSQDRPGEAIAQSADVTREGDIFTAKGGSSDALYFEPYVMQELPPAPTEHGHWVLISVTCDGQEVPFAAGAAVVHITEAASKPVCLFTNRFEVKEEPPPPIEEFARVSLTKVTNTPDIKLGQKAHFTISVTGEGPARAREVVVDDQTGSAATFVSAVPSQGKCNHSLPLHCELGGLEKGAKATIHVVVIPHHAGRFENHAVAGLGNPDPDFSKDTAHAHVLVRARRHRVPSQKPSFTG